MDIPKKLSIVTFTAFNQKGVMYLENVDESDVEEEIRCKTSNTAVIHTIVEYGVSSKKKIMVSEYLDNIPTTLSDKFINDMNVKLSKKKKTDE